MSETITINTSELEEAALDWAVAKCEGIEVLRNPFGADIPGFWTVGGMFNSAHKKVGWQYSPSTNWALAGPIIEQQGIQIQAGFWDESGGIKEWFAYALSAELGMSQGQDLDDIGFYGLTPLVAAMRCYVAAKLGPEVDIPSELAQQRKVPRP